MAPPPITPAPLPTQVVDVQLPPDVIARLTPPDPGWFTQPVATIMAAMIALVAAGIAFGGVWWQVLATDRRSREDRAIVAAKDARVEKVEMFMQLVDSLIATRMAAFDAYFARGTSDEIESITKHRDAVRHAELNGIRVRILGYDKILTATLKVTRATHEMADYTGKDLSNSKLDRRVTDLIANVNLLIMDELGVQKLTDDDEAEAK